MTTTEQTRPVIALSTITGSFADLRAVDDWERALGLAGRPPEFVADMAPEFDRLTARIDQQITQALREAHGPGEHVDQARVDSWLVDAHANTVLIKAKAEASAA